MEHCKYSIFILSVKQYFENSTYTEDRMEYVETFDTLKEAKEFQIQHQGIYALPTIIIPTY